MGYRKLWIWFIVIMVGSFSVQQPHLETFRWLRVIGDTLFAVGAVALAWFIAGLKTGWSLKTEIDVSEEIFRNRD